MLWDVPDPGLDLAELWKSCPVQLLENRTFVAGDVVCHIASRAAAASDTLLYISVLF